MSTKITLVTIAYNDLAGLRNTITSVEESLCTDFEYIVIDGGSTDGSVEFLKEKLGVIDKYVSERDSGIYEAMNKGVNLANGDYVLFLNSGDMLYSCETVGVLRDKLPAAANTIYYGDAYFVNGRKVATAGVEKIWKGMIFSHQAVLCPRWMLKRDPFDVNMEIAADYKFFLALFASGVSAKSLGLWISVLEDGGVSQTSQLKSVGERYEALLQFDVGQPIYWKMWYLWLMMKVRLKSWVKRFV